MPKSMKPSSVEKAAPLVAALKELPSTSRRLRNKVKRGPNTYHDSVWLELSAAEMDDGEGQGSSSYFYVPPALGRKVLAATRKIIEAELRKLGVQP